MRKKLNILLNDCPVYDEIMIVVILVSLVPLLFKHPIQILRYTDIITAAIFSADYLARWLTADMTSERSPAVAFFTYPIRIMAIIDLLSILPVIAVVNPALKAFRILRLVRALRVFRLFRYSKSIQIINRVFQKQRRALMTVGWFAAGYIFVSALVIFQIEPDTFGSFFDALYWATISLTTVGYGDIFATSTIGKLITMISALMGIAVVALPAGIITAGYMDELNTE